MRKTLLSILALTVIIGLMLSMSAPALAGQIYHYRGTGVNAYWFMYDAKTGVYTDIYVYGYDSMDQSPPGHPQAKQYAGIEVLQYRYDGDEYVPLSEVSYWGPAGCLVIDSKLASASLVADDLEAWKWDYIADEETAVSLDVDVSWVATGPLSQDSYRWHSHSSYMNANRHYNNKSREATAQGSVCYDGTSVIPGASDGASIFSTKEGYVEVSR